MEPQKNLQQAMWAFFISFLGLLSIYFIGSSYDSLTMLPQVLKYFFLVIFLVFGIWGVEYIILWLKPLTCKESIDKSQRKKFGRFRSGQRVFYWKSQGEIHAVAVFAVIASRKDNEKCLAGKDKNYAGKLAVITEDKEELVYVPIDDINTIDTKKRRKTNR